MGSSPPAPQTHAPTQPRRAAPRRGGGHPAPPPLRVWKLSRDETQLDRIKLLSVDEEHQSHRGFRLAAPAATLAHQRRGWAGSIPQKPRLERGLIREGGGGWSREELGLSPAAWRSRQPLSLFSAGSLSRGGHGQSRQGQGHCGSPPEPWRPAGGSLRSLSCPWATFGD